MGLTETVTPIICDGSIVGYIMMGQKLMREDVEGVRERISEFPDESKRAKLLEALEKIKFTSLAELDSMCSLVEMCVSYLHMKKLIKFSETPTWVLLKNYVRDHISDELDIKKMCREFKMSKSSLYLFSVEHFGVGITEYIKNVRMEMAQDMLSTTDEPVSLVAERLGYTDANYFTKVFKKCTGVTPTAWRKRGQKTNN